jgi:TolA-binding protein
MKYFLCLLTICPALASADSVWIQSGSGNPIALGNVKVTGIDLIVDKDGKPVETLQFATSAGRPSTKLLTQVPQISLDDEPAFTAAEEAFKGGDLAGATQNYQKALSTTTKGWLKERIAARLVAAAEKSNNFPAAVTGFVELMQINLALATANKPSIPQKQAAAIDPAIALLKQASQNPKLTADQKTVLGNYMVEVYNAKGDSAAANSALSQITKPEMKAQVAPVDNRRINADLRLTEARQAYSQREFAKAAQILNSSGALFSEPQEQAEALYLWAQATSAAEANNPNQLKDAALAYMRVVAVCDGLPDKPHVAESLLNVAAIEEKLNNPKEATAVYTQVAEEFKDTPAAATAKQAITRLTPPEKK